MPAEQYSKNWWIELCESRLASAPAYEEAIGGKWLRGQFGELGVATHQVQCHPLLRIVCAGDGATLRTANAAFSELASAQHFDQRVDGLRDLRDEHQFWAKWNEIRSAYSVVRSGLSVSFPTERGNNLGKSPEFVFSWGGQNVAVEVATISETKERVGARNRFLDELLSAVKAAKKSGRGGAFGGVVPQPERFGGGWSTVSKLRSIKSGSKQSVAYGVKLLNVIVSSNLLLPLDFLPDGYLDNEGLRYRYSGRIYNAHYGIKGQSLYWHHSIGRSNSFSRTSSVQKDSGRFVDNTSVSAAIWTMHPHCDDGSAALSSQEEIIYCPLAGAGASAPEGLVKQLDQGFRFNRNLSVVPGLSEEFPGPHRIR
ncbi:hypothetical protein [Corallococcus carmarthensis]|uniref:hypothetical protein n=1 Tax=Corallococcus carmarthensis TaxID=2316728 RepID=UPI0011C473C7|nr:hypothetical protein [Corallococcus carmarthensis]